MLKSACSAENWRQEVNIKTKRLKTISFPSWNLPGHSSCSTSTTHWNFKGHFLKNQKGSLEIFGVSLLFVLITVLGLLIHLWQYRYEQVNEHLKQTLCLKEAMLETHLMVARINKLNSAILAGEVTSWALVLVGVGLATKPSWEQVKKALQVAQELQWLNSQRILLSLKKKSCSLPLTVWPSPYKWNGKLARSLDGRALMRSRQSIWPIKTPLMTYVARWKSSNDFSPNLIWEVY